MIFNKIKNYISYNLKKQYIDQEKYWIAQYLPNNPNIIEAGAHVGYDTRQMSALWRKGTIYGFEPVPHIYQELKKNTEGIRNIKLFQMALSNQTGTQEMFVSEGSQNASSSLLAPKEHINTHPEVKFNEKIKIKTQTIDDWANENMIDHIDFMWLDMQGYELATLKASPRILSTVKIIHTEVNLIENYENVPLYPEIKAWFESHNFEIIKEDFSPIDYGDVTFMKK